MYDFHCLRIAAAAVVVAAEPFARTCTSLFTPETITTIVCGVSYVRLYVSYFVVVPFAEESRLLRCR